MPTSASDAWPGVGAWLAVGGLVAGAWWLTWLAGGSHTVAPHLFYVPVLVAAFRFGLTGALAAAVVAGFVAGPLMPLDVTAGTSQTVGNWLPRLGAFALIGVAVALMVRRIQHAHDLERELAARRDTILRIVDHELRTPTTVLKGGLELVTSAKALGEASFGRLVEAMRNASQRLEGLATVVSASVGNTAGREPTAYVLISDVVTDALRHMPSRHDRDRVHVEERRPVLLRTHRDHLKVVLVCLIDNALRFSPDDRPVEVAIEGDNEVCRVIVRDEGPGLPAAGVDELFDAFTQADTSSTRPYQGMGLGLYAARRIALELGGAVILEPRTAGPGAVATVTLPVDSAAYLEAARNTVG